MKAIERLQQKGRGPSWDQVMAWMNKRWDAPSQRASVLKRFADFFYHCSICGGLGVRDYLTTRPCEHPVCQEVLKQYEIEYPPSKRWEDFHLNQLNVKTICNLLAKAARRISREQQLGSKRRENHERSDANDIQRIGSADW